MSCKYFSSKLIPITALSLFVLGTGAFVSGIGSDLGLVRSAHAETASTDVSVDVPLILSITSSTPTVEINAAQTGAFYTGNASIVSTTNNPTGYTLTMANNDTNTILV